MPLIKPARGFARSLAPALLLASVLAAGPAAADPGETSAQPAVSGTSAQPPPMTLPQETTTCPKDGYTGMPVPPFTASTVTGRRLTTDDPEALALIIDLWGLNCASCLAEMAALEPVYEEFRERGLRIWSVNAEGIPTEKILAGLEKKGLNFPYEIIVDQDCSVTHLFTRWFIPVTVIVDRHGIVQYYKVGFNPKDIDKIRGKVAELVAP